MNDENHSGWEFYVLTFLNSVGSLLTSSGAILWLLFGSTQVGGFLLCMGIGLHLGTFLYEGMKAIRDYLENFDGFDGSGFGF